MGPMCKHPDIVPLLQWCVHLPCGTLQLRARDGKARAGNGRVFTPRRHPPLPKTSLANKFSRLPLPSDPQNSITLRTKSQKHIPLLWNRRSKRERNTAPGQTSPPRRPPPQFHASPIRSTLLALYYGLRRGVLSGHGAGLAPSHRAHPPRPSRRRLGTHRRRYRRSALHLDARRQADVLLT